MLRGLVLPVVLFTVGANLPVDPAAGAQAPAAAAQPAPAGNAAAGRKIYVKVGCHSCHGNEGQGAQPTGPRLAPNPTAFAAFSRYVRAPRANMPPYSERSSRTRRSPTFTRSCGRSQAPRRSIACCRLCKEGDRRPDTGDRHAYPDVDSCFCNRPARDGRADRGAGGGSGFHTGGDLPRGRAAAPAEALSELPPAGADRAVLDVHLQGHEAVGEGHQDGRRLAGDAALVRGPRLRAFQ